MENCQAAICDAVSFMRPRYNCILRQAVRNMPSFVSWSVERISFSFSSGNAASTPVIAVSGGAETSRQRAACPIQCVR